jgi:sporulation protein YlmC with PRC-barrel domain
VTNKERLRELEEKYEGYKVYDNAGERIGKVDDLFVDDANREEYIGVKTGFFGLKSTLIPMDIVRVNEQERTIEVSESKDRVKDAPNFDDDGDITPDYEDRVRRHFGLESPAHSAESGSYGRYSGAATEGTIAGGAAEGDRETEDRVGRESYRNREDIGSGSAMESAGAREAEPSGGMEDLETGDRGRVTDEGFREGYREGFREGYREGLHEGGSRDERSGDLGPSGSTTPEGDRSMGSDRPGGEAREIPSRSSGEDEREDEGGRTRVWQRSRR